MLNRHAELFQAVKDEKAKVVAALLSRGEDLNARGVYGETPIYWAIKQNDIKTVKGNDKDIMREATWIPSARALIGRVLGERAALFNVEPISPAGGHDVFELSSTRGVITLRGNNPVSVASALNWYLKHYAKCHVSWCGDQLNLPSCPPPVSGTVRVVNPSRYRVYFNYCTLSYTAAWWDWKRWEREIDFMALNGINMPLAVIGIEGVWYNTLLKMGFTDAEAREFLVGPAYQAWQWMQDIERYGGPLPKSWIDRHVELGRQILERERELGMMPIQQGFSGAVPHRLKEKFPHAEMSPRPMWFGFNGVMQLDPLDTLFARMGSVFLDEQKRLFGSSHFYGCDPFHESAPPKPGEDYLRAVGAAIAGLLDQHDPMAVWCMQSWSLRREIVEAASKDRLLVLDLGGRWKSTESFWGYPFVCGLIHNFGGRTRLCGDLVALSKNPFGEALQAAPNCCGMGLFPEAIGQNPVYYDMAFDLVWRESGVEAGLWVREYARRRYGAESPAVNEAWMTLLRTVYQSDMIYASALAARPALDLRMADPNWGLGMPYNPAEVARAWEVLLDEAERLKSSAGYRYDITDLGRQVLADLAQPLHWKVANAFLNRDRAAFAAASKKFLDLFADADALCGTQPGLSFRKWMRAAQSWATSPEERTLYTFNAGMVVTHWGGDIVPRIFDYSWREWGGLIAGYYRGRWDLFHAMLAERLEKGDGWSEAGLPLDFHRPKLTANPFYAGLYEWEMAWIRADKTYDADSVGDSITVAQALLKKYKPLMEHWFSPDGRAQWAEQQARVRDQRLAGELGQRVWRWDPAEVDEEIKDVAFDLTSALEVGSEFELTFLRESGDMLAVCRVIILQDGTPVARDEHDGFTGKNGADFSQNHVYRFHLPMVVPGAVYTVKASIRAQHPKRSGGAVWLKKRA